MKMKIHYTYFFRSVCLLLFVFSASSAMAQVRYYQVSGKVLQGDTKAPMQSASVQAQHTTIGTATDTEGNFTIYLPEGGYELAFSFTGYQTESRRVSSSDGNQQTLIVELKPREKELEAVAVVASNEVKDGWEKYGSFFKDAFIGKTANSAHCHLLNPSVLKFYFSKKRNRLKVLSEEPLQIENKALGYTIRYTLDSFVHEYQSGISQYTGFPMFEELRSDDPAQVKAWKEARSKAYRGSILHFMRSVYQQRLTEEGFEIQFLISVNNRDTAIRLKNYYGAMNYKKDDSTQTVSVRPNQLQVAVIYIDEPPAPEYRAINPEAPEDFQFSVLNFQPGDQLFIEKNGFYFEQPDITIRDYWTWDKLADMLPYDYVVE